MADDEPVFLQATADILRREGFEVFTVGDADAAIAEVARADYELVITDLEMPGNADLALIRSLSETNGGLPIIVLTGYPSVRTATACIDMPCAAYLTKPVDVPVLVTRTRTAVERYRAWKSMRRSEERLRAWREEMDQLSQVEPTGGGVDTFLALTLRNVMGSLTDLQHLGEALAKPKVEVHVCQIMNCPRGAQLQQAVTHTVEVLEATKGSFKSKALGDLRHQLELLLKHS
jgi:CheY-like chemotaxis protein